MNTHQTHFFFGRCDIFLGVLRISEIVQRDSAVGAKRQVVLRNLIVLRHVRIEIIFAIEFADRSNIASEHESGEHRHAQRLMIHHRQGAGQTEAHRASVRIRFRSELNRRSAEHFRGCLQLDVHFQTDRGDVIHGYSNIR